jgi:hypothetical protein
VRRLVVAAFVLLLSAAARWQEPLVLVDRAIRERLAEEWHADDRYQSERIYHVWYTQRWEDGNYVFRIVDIMRAYEEGGTPSGVGYEPIDDARVTTLHTHPPTTCDDPEDGGTCAVGGDYAYQCFPSDADMESLNRSKQVFALIQCDKWALVPYWRTRPVTN